MDYFLLHVTGMMKEELSWLFTSFKRKNVIGNETAQCDTLETLINSTS